MFVDFNGSSDSDKENVVRNPSYDVIVLMVLLAASGSIEEYIGGVRIQIALAVVHLYLKRFKVQGYLLECSTF